MEFDLQYHAVPPSYLRPSRKKLDEEFRQEAARKLANDDGSENRQRVYVLVKAYQPCTQSLLSLAPIHLRDLILESHHRGYVLIVRCFSVPNRTKSIHNAVEDAMGDVERLSIFNLPPNVEADDALPLGAVVAVKDPYYKRVPEGGFCIRTDHPSDVVLLKPGHPLIPQALADKDDRAAGPSALALKEIGNEAFKKEAWLKADKAYSDALDAAPDDNLKNILLRNRVMTRLRLGRYELAHTDALASMDAAENATNAKSLYQAGRASYEMGKFDQAREHFEAVLAIDAGQEEATAELARTKMRLDEQENGTYDFAAMFKAARKGKGCLDHASFLKNVRVGPAGDRGRGLFATKDLEAGEVIFVEKAFDIAHPDSSNSNTKLYNTSTGSTSPGLHVNLLAQLVDKLRWNPALASQFLDLYDGGKFKGSKEAIIADGQVVVDTFRVQSIVEFNCFACPRVRPGESRDKEDLGAGVWLRAAYANNACVPNGARSSIGDMMIVRAVRPIRAGEEIFVAYLNAQVPASKRQKAHKKRYNFECDCSLCTAEAQVPSELRKRRNFLFERVKEFLDAHPLSADNFRTIPLATRAAAKGLLKELRDTYPTTLFNGLPRMACVWIGFWEAQAGPTRTKANLYKMLLVLRDSGYRVTIQQGQAQIDRTAAVVSEPAMRAAVETSQMLAEDNKPGAAFALRSLAREIFTSRYGVREEYDEKFKWGKQRKKGY